MKRRIRKKQKINQKGTANNKKNVFLIAAEILRRRQEKIMSNVEKADFSEKN